MGMSLSEIIYRLNQLKQFDPKPFDDIAQVMSDTAKIYADIKFTNKQNLTSSMNKVNESIERYKNDIEELKRILENTIYNDHDRYVDEGIKIWHEQYVKMTFKEHLEWIDLIPPNSNDLMIFETAIANSTSWQQPALIAGANKSDIIKPMVGSEPLYTVEHYPEYFDLQKEKFSVDYQRRLRCYSFTELNLLPQNAFGLIVVYNQFPFLPWKKVTGYLDQLIPALSPGGTLFFNYNNCYSYKGFRYFEDRIMTYTLPEMYYKHCNMNGLVLETDYLSPSNDFAFMKFNKPGTMNLIKKYPSFGMIVQQPTLTEPANHNQRLEKIKKIFKT
jgi:hypothetical protein